MAPPAGRQHVLHHHQYTLPFQSYLLVKILSPVKDLEQPVSMSFSSSTLGVEGEENPVRRVEEELEEDKELNSPSPSFTLSDLGGSGAPPKASACSPGSQSMTAGVFWFLLSNPSPAHIVAGGATLHLTQDTSC